ncbi:Fpg/Nei family DNA glycosylase [Luteipulveratus mongoliensis]|uniref:DNA-(apurinic or apyrimidinic site) lyase n=1 Tax=Luteipulveratus mongoliensis TaxID=571913 RepID=A0A0K1JL68_9MICO|nr:DNA-formamidopyrimidine glycosylase family protein [Luteipulveratus mongoliensis]AKU17315.1 DNA glycosylase [Luteipulveratus mongoliensis]
MPEGDVLLRTARRLHHALVDEPLVVADLRWSGLSELDLTGRRTTEVISRGKHLLHRLEGGATIHSHLRMEGHWWVERRDQVRPGVLRSPDLRAALATTEWAALGWQLGMLDVVDTAQESTVVGHLGPDLLGPDWQESVAVDNLHRSAQSLGAALLDQRNLAGLGTIYASESLFVQRLSPWQPASAVSEDALQLLVRRAQRLLKHGAEVGRPSITGDPREPTYVHARSGRPCRRCGGPVRVSAIGTAPRERPMFYCPQCQGGLGPDDDGRPQRPLGAR